MATSCPMNFNVGYLRDQVRNTYDQVAREPNRHYHFHRGPDYAHSFLGYDRNELAALPALSTERFAGVGNPLAIGPVEPGGRLYLADVVVQRELTEEARSNPDLWAACVAGALVESELVTLAGKCGFTCGQVRQRFNCFYDTTAEAKVAKDLFIQSVNFYARKEADA